MLKNMRQRWGAFWTSSKNLRSGWLVAAGIVALYVGAIRPHEIGRGPGIANSRGTGPAEFYKAAPTSPWYQEGMLPRRRNTAATKGVIGGVPGGVPDNDKGGEVVTASLIEAPVTAPQPQDAEAGRKMIRNCSLDLVVQTLATTVEKIRALAEQNGGFLVSSEVRGGSDATGGSLTIRVPVGRFEEVRAEIRKLGLRVESEKIEASDVTRQYVDQGANLRNLRAEETQYLAILKQSHTVKDTLEVSEKLSGVRGQIEEQQAEFNALSQQIETAAISILLRTEAETRVLGLNWRPLYQLKLALRNGLDGLADYASTMTEIVFYLPAVVLWLATVVVGGAMGWRLVRWIGRRWFGWAMAEVPAKG